MTNLVVRPAPQGGLWRVHRRKQSPVSYGIKTVDPNSNPVINAAETADAAVATALSPFHPSPELARHLANEKWVGAVPVSWAESRTLSRLVVGDAGVFIDADVLAPAYGFNKSDIGTGAVQPLLARLFRQLASEHDGGPVVGFCYPARNFPEWRLFAIFPERASLSIGETEPGSYESSMERVMTRLGLTLA